MASTFSPLLRIELIGAGEQAGAWNNTTNTNLGTLIEQAIAGSTSVSLDSTTYNLGSNEAINFGASDIQRNMAITFTGDPGGDVTVTIPATSKLYFIRNSTSGTASLKLKTAAQLLANAVVVPNGKTMIVGCDGTNAVVGINSLPASSTIGSDIIATVSGTETLTNKTLTAPKFADNGFISDPHANEMLAFDTLASGLIPDDKNSYLSVSNGPSALVVTGASGNGTTATVTYNAGNSTQVPVGAAVTIAAVSPAGYNGTYTVTASSAGSVSYTNSTTATYSSGGTVSIEPAIAAVGTNSNIDINLVPKGTGVVRFKGSPIATDGSNTFTSSQVISVTNDTNPALLITQLGTGEALRVEDSTNPDATPFVVTASGNVGINGSTTAAELTIGGTQQNRLWLDAFGTTNRQLFVRANGTAAAKTIVASGESVGSNNFFGYDGVGNIELANIVATVDGTPGTNDMPGRLTFATTADGASSPTERFRIGSAGQLGIGGATYGTAGQVLTSGGASAPPTWTTPSRLVVGTAITISNQASADFTGIPAGVNRITVSCFNVFTVGENWLQIQLGTSSGYVTSGYSSGSFTQGGSSTFSDAFSIRNSGNGSSGTMTLARVTGNLWVASHAFQTQAGGGALALSGTLDRVRLKAQANLTSGWVNIMYE